MRPVRLLNMELRSRFGGLPNWRSLMQSDAERWATARARADGPKVLIATSVGSHLIANTLDSTLAVALTLRQANVHGFLCDRVLPACLSCEMDWWPDHDHFVAHGPTKTLCRPCYEPAAAMWRDMGLTLQTLGRFVTPAEREAFCKLANDLPESELDAHEHLGVRVGMHARSGTLRYFARGTLDGEPDADPIRRRYLAAALIATTAIDRLFEAERYDVCVAHHGIYVPQGLIVELARKHGIRIVTWNIAYRAGSFIFSHDDTYHFTLMTEPIDAWSSMGWDSRLQSALDDYMTARRTGAKDWISYQEGSQQELDTLAAEYGIDFSKPTVAAFTNVLWDAQVFYRSNAFPSMLDWIVETIRYFARRPDLQLVVRVHPAEIKNPLRTRQKLVDELARAFPELPKNVFVIPPESPAGSYAIAAGANAAIIYGTKMGVELSYMGIPTIVAGESWARNKGLTLDADSREAYFELLDRLPLAEGLDDETRKQAAKYAFHFFFRRTIPLDFLSVQRGAWPPFKLKLDSLAPLLPGADPGLDLICEGILEGAPFVYPAETLIQDGKLSH